MPFELPFELLATLSGTIVGFVLGLVGGGGSILAVPLLIYVVGVPSTHIAIGTSAVAVAASAAVNLLPHWRAGRVKWPCAIVFSVSGVVGALVGSTLAKLTDGEILLFAFGSLMLVVGVTMLLNRKNGGDENVRLTTKTAIQLGPKLVAVGMLVGVLSGYFGIGGGFLIVPGLMLATGMPLAYAIGTSLVAVTAFGIATASNYAASGLVDWPLAGLFVVGGAVGGLIGARVSGVLSTKGRALPVIFALVVLTTGGWILWQSYGVVFGLVGP